MEATPRRFPVLHKLFGILALGGALGAAGAAHAADSAYGTCRPVVLPVAPAAGQPASETLSGTYCEPIAWAGGPHSADVMTPGATYNRAYWDWPRNPALYSFVDKTLQAGRAAFFYDRIGTGSSSHPLSIAVTTQGDAYALHQAVQWLRTQGARQIDSIGHSYGSIIAITEAATYQDVDRLIVTGLLHMPSGGLANLSALLYLATLSPSFAGMNLDAGYLTTMPGSRGIFYSASADPSVIAYDNAHPDTVTATDIATALTVLEGVPPLNIADRITAPVLLVSGQQDKFFCSVIGVVSCADQTAVQAYEAPYFASAKSLTVNMVADTGHDLPLHPSANVSFNLIDQWIHTH